MFTLSHTEQNQSIHLFQNSCSKRTKKKKKKSIKSFQQLYITLITYLFIISIIIITTTILQNLHKATDFLYLKGIIRYSLHKR